MRKRRGSFTIEAAIIIPLFLLIILIAADITIEFYQETIELVAEIDDKERINLVIAMYHMDSIKQLFFGVVGN